MLKIINENRNTGKETIVNMVTGTIFKVNNFTFYYRGALGIMNLNSGCYTPLNGCDSERYEIAKVAELKVEF